MGAVHEDMRSLFKEDVMARHSVEKYTDEQLRTMSDSTKKKGDLNEAMRMYRLLRPDAPPFYEEDAMLSMKAKMNRILVDEAEKAAAEASFQFTELDGKRVMLEQECEQMRQGLDEMRKKGGEASPEERELERRFHQRSEELTQAKLEGQQARKVATAEIPQLQKLDEPDALFDPFKCYLPVVNQRAFLLALESVVASVAEDVETMCLLAGVCQDDLPAPEDPLRFKRLLDTLFGAFPLEKDPSRVDEFMKQYWPKMKNLLPADIAMLDEEVVADWLRGHLRRVNTNQKRLSPSIALHGQSQRSEDSLYNFAEDFPYDDDPMPGLLADERNLEFPLGRAGEFMSSFLGALSASPLATEVRQAMGGLGETAAAPEGPGQDVSQQFQDLVWDLEKVGLRNWLRMDVNELERFLPKGNLAEFQLKGSQPRGANSIELEPDDIKVAKLMLRCAARGRSDLLDFEAVDPYKMLYGFPARQVDEELAELPGNTFVSDDALCGLVDAFTERLGRRDQGEDETSKTRREKTEEAYETWKDQGASVDEIYRKELEFYRSAGPVEWTQNADEGYSWKWRQPQNTFWDPQAKVYIQEKRGVDPTLNLKEMRQHLLAVSRMNTMVKSGRANFFRAIVVVGNGKGVYGFGVGFGKTPKDARADAALKALQNLDYIDLDIGRMLCFPTRGREYKYEATIIPRALGKGLQANKRFYPLLYILGLDNCRVKFKFDKWFTRIRALRRALDGIVSRRTLANMTGKRYSLLVAPGDHWVHWPDRWFKEIRKPYDAKAFHARLVRRHQLHFKKRANVTATALELKPGWRKDNWARWNNPLERWIQELRRPRVAGRTTGRDTIADAPAPGRGASLPQGPGESGSPKLSESLPSESAAKDKLLAEGRTS